MKAYSKNTLIKKGITIIIFINKKKYEIAVWIEDKIQERMVFYGMGLSW